MARRLVGITLERRLVTVPVAGDAGCVTDMVTCCEGSGSGSGAHVCGDEECVLTCDQCLTGVTAVWELAATGYDPPIYLCHVEVPDDGNYCRWVSPDQAWELRYNYGDSLWTLENYDTGDFFYTDAWDCDGENILLNIDEGGDSAVITPVYACTDVSYNCVDGTCVSVSGTGGTYATLAECAAVCGGGTVDSPCCPDNLISAVLTATWSNVTGGCVGCLPTVLLVYGPAPGNWASDQYDSCPTSPGLGSRMTLGCDAPDQEWIPSLDCLGMSPVFTLVSQSCSPFELVYDVTFTPFGGSFACCNGLAGTGRLTITG